MQVCKLITFNDDENNILNVNQYVSVTHYTVIVEGLLEF